MIYDLPPELEEIRQSVKKMAQSEVPAFLTEQHFGKVPRSLFAKMAELGLTGLAIDQEYGGLSADALTSAVVYAEIARVDLGPTVFLSVHNMISGILNRFGSSEQKQTYLPRLASGELLGAFALTEANAGSDAAKLRTQAVLKGDQYILNGEKVYITSAGFADLYIVFARTNSEGSPSKGISAFIVEKDSKGLGVSEPEKKMGCELSPIASLNFENVSIPASRRIGQEGDGFKIALSGLAGGRINIGACAVGLAQSAIERSIAHLQEREQFDQKLIDFQGLQFMLADMQMQLEASRLLTFRAAELLDNSVSKEKIILASSAAKCFASDAAMKITTDAVQLLGGAGYIREYQVERLMRDAKMLQIVVGTNQIQRVVIAREMKKEGFEV